MSQRRGSASPAVAAVTVFALLYLLGQTEPAQAATFTVGDSSGWGFGVDSWPKGKSFSAGDVLVFNYNPAFHNVVPVSSTSYQSCSAPAGSKVFTSGKDQITLVKGDNYFFCSIGDHCQKGVEIAVNAA